MEGSNISLNNSETFKAFGQPIKLVKITLINTITINYFNKSKSKTNL